MEYNNPYTSQNNQVTGTDGTSQSGMNTGSAQTGTMTYPSKPRTNWMVSIILLLVGLIAGAAAGYFAGQFLIFGPKLDTAANEKSQLQAQVATLQGQLANNTTPTTPTTPTAPTTPTITTITPDPATAAWTQYSDAEHHVFFKVAPGTSQSGFQNSGDLAKLNDDKTYLGIGILKPGDSTPFAYVYLYTPEGNSGSRGDGPTHADLVNLFVQHANISVMPTVNEKSVILNGTNATELSATFRESTFTAYLIEDKFGTTYLTSACKTPVTLPDDTTACQFLTTVEIK